MPLMLALFRPEIVFFIDQLNRDVYSFPHTQRKWSYENAVSVEITTMVCCSVRLILAILGATMPVMII